jgi:hypothetical protein
MSNRIELLERWASKEPAESAPFLAFAADEDSTDSAIDAVLLFSVIQAIRARPGWAVAIHVSTENDPPEQVYARVSDRPIGELRARHLACVAFGESAPDTVLEAYVLALEQVVPLNWKMLPADVVNDELPGTSRFVHKLDPTTTCENCGHVNELRGRCEKCGWDNVRHCMMAPPEAESDQPFVGENLSIWNEPPNAPIVDLPFKLPELSGPTAHFVGGKLLPDGSSMTESELVISSCEQAEKEWVLPRVRCNEFLCLPEHNPSHYVGGRHLPVMGDTDEADT